MAVEDLRSKDRLKGYKKELYHLSGRLIQHVVDRAFARYDGGIYGTGLYTTEEASYEDVYEPEHDRGDQVGEFYVSVDSFFDPGAFFIGGYGDSFEALSGCFEKTLEYHWDETVKELAKRKKGAKNSELQDVYDRYLIITSKLGLKPRDFITQGLLAKLDVIRRLSILIPYLYQQTAGEEITEDQFENITISSFPLLRQLADANIKKSRQVVDFAFETWDDFWGWRGIRPDFFQLTDSYGELQLALSEQGQELYDSPIEHDEPTVGCPALIPGEPSDQGLSSMEKVWRWYTGIIKEHLFDEVKERYKELTDLNTN